MVSPTQARLTDNFFRNPIDPSTIESKGHRTDNEILIYRETQLDSLTNNDFGLGSKGAEVSRLQQELEDAGYDTGGVDGDFGPKTQAAVREFQVDEIASLRQELSAGGLSIRAAEHKHEQIVALEKELAQGVAGDVTKVQLNENSINPDLELGIGARGKQVNELQQALETQGIETGGVDGIYGPLTDAAVKSFQQEQIKNIEFLSTGFVPLTAEQNEILNNLRDEFERGVAGPQTIEMLDPGYELPARDFSDIPVIPEFPLPEVSGPEDVGVPPTEDIELDIPDFDDINSAADSLEQRHFSDALRDALNSEGDSVSLDLEVRANLPVVVPGTTVGGASSIGAEVERVADGYEVSIEAGVAAELGLAVNSDDLDAVAFAELGGRVTYKYATIEEAEQAVRDLALTAGNHPALDTASDLADRGLDVADFLLNNPVTDTIGRFIPGGDLILGIDRAILNEARSLFDSYNSEREEAVDRLNDSFSSNEISVALGAEANLELEGLLPVDLENFGLGGSGRQFGEVSAVFDADGSITVSAEYQGELSAAAGLGLGVEGEIANSVGYSQRYIRDPEGGYKTDGSAILSFNGDVQAQAEAGIGLSESRGQGGEYSLEIEVDELTASLRSAADNFLQGDVETALDNLGGIEGDLTIQGRATGSLEASLGGGYLGAELGVEGELEVNDKGEAIELEDLTIDDAFDFLKDEVRDAVTS